MGSLKSQIHWCGRMQIGLLAVVLAVAATFYFGCYRPEDARLRQLSFDIAGARRDLGMSSARAQGLPAVVADIAHLRAELADFKRLPRNLELGEFVTEITELSREANLQKLEYSLSGAPQPGEHYTVQPVTLKFEGDFLNVFTFLQRAEEMQRLTRVSSIAIHDSDSNSGDVQVDLSMDLYFSEG
ncbi:MAG: type 4a pilus biogenesis protein PilO [Tepidisphaeraceae bacterium]